MLVKAQQYLKNNTTARGGVTYASNRGGPPVGGERVPLTAGALACACSRPDFNDPKVKAWLKFCQGSIKLPPQTAAGFDEFTLSYYAQAVYALGDDGYAELFPKAPAEEVVRWTDFRAKLFDNLQKTQAPTGAWTTTGGWGVGPVYSTALYATILQLDNATLPIFQR